MITLTHKRDQSGTVGLGGGQVAVLGLHAAVSLPRNDCTILAELGERVTQLQNLLLARSFQALRSLATR
jgi:hypothetical protein